MAVNAMQYIKNVGKSFGYSAIDSFKAYNPQVTSLASGAKELGSDLYQSIQSFKASMVDTETEKGFIGKGKDTINEFRTNLFEDLKSGNWYNKQRIDQVENEAIGAMFGFDDSDFNLDDLDFEMNDLDDEVDDGNDAATIVAAQKKSTDSIISTIDAVGSKSAAAISTATVRSADYVVQSNRQSSKALYSLNQRGFHQVSTGLAAINANITSLVSLGEPLTAHMQNSATFYTQTSEYQKSVLEKLDMIVKAVSPDEWKGAKAKDNTLSSILNDGVIDLPAYFSMISQSVKSFKDEMMGFVDMFGGPEQVIKMGTSSPLKLITTGLTKVVIPKIMKESMQSFNASMEEFFGAAINKLQNMSFSGIAGDLYDMIKGVIFPKSGFKDKVDPGNYNKGKVNWDGKSKKALEDVIPTYLSNITAALTGGPVTVYDYDSGKFVSKNTVRLYNDQRMTKAAQNAGGDFREDALAVARGKGLSKEELKQVEEGIENYFLNAFKKGDAKQTEINKANFDYQSFGLDEQSLAILREVLREYGKVPGATKRALRAATNIPLGRDKFGDETRRMESEGDIITSLFNNSDIISSGDKKNKVKPGGILGTDNYNHDVFFYLQGIYQYTGHLSDNIGFIGTGKGGRNRGKIGRALSEPKPIPKGISPEEANRIANANTDTQSDKKYKVQSASDVLADRLSYSDDTRKRKTKGEKNTEAANKAKKDREKALGLSEGEDEENESEDSAKDRFIRRLKEAGDSNEKVSAFSKIRDKISGIFATPGNVIAEILAAGETSMYHLIYGKGSDDEKGLFAYFYEKANKLFDKFDKFFEDKFGKSIKDWAKQFVEKTGLKGFFKGFAGDTKEELKNVWYWSKDKVKKTVFGKGNNPGEGQTEPIENAAFGRKVTKTGIIAVSEGELVLPSQFNPYYHGTNNKKTQLNKESAAISKFFGRYAEGGTVGEGGAEEKLTGRERRDRNVEKAKGATNLKDIAVGGASKLLNGIQDAIDIIVPKDKKKEKSKIAKFIDEGNAKEYGEEIKKNRGAMGAGALIGAGASILSGAIVGPLAGAAIGAGVGLVVRSEKIQDALFGKKDKDGNRDYSGLLSEKMGKFVEKQVPSIGIGAGAGLVGGLFMGSPILGAFLGGAIGFASSSDKFKNWLFGEKDKDGKIITEGVIKQKTQQKIKESMPNMAAGAIAGLIAGPFGLVGNIVVGSAIGYATTTDKFKDLMLGKVIDEKTGKREGGLLGEIRTYFFGKKENDEKQGVLVSINGIFKKLANEMKIHAENLFKNTTKTIRSLISRGVKSTFGQKLANSKVAKVGKKVAGAAVSAAKLPFKGVRAGLEGIDTKLGKRALRQGYNIENKDGKMMTASERIKAKEDYGMSTTRRTSINNFDNYLASITDKSQLEELQQVLSYYEDPTKQYDKDESKAKTKFARMLDEQAFDGLNAKTKIQLEKLAVGKGKGNIEEILKNNGIDITSGAGADLLAKYNEIGNIRSQRSAAQADKKSARQQLLQKEGVFKKAGFDIKSDSDLRNYQKLVKAEMEGRFKEKTDEEKAKDKETQVQDSVIKISDVVQNIYYHITGQTDKIKDLSGKDKESANKAKEAVNNADGGISDSKESVVTQVDAFGNVYQLRENEQGERVMDETDSQTQAAMDSQNKIKNALYSIPLIGGAMNGLGGILSGLKDGLLGTEEKEGVFSKLFGSLFGDNGFLSGIFSFITGSKLGTTVKNVLSNGGTRSIMSGLITEIVGPALLLAGFSGKFDEVGASLSSSISALKGNETGSNGTLADNTSTTINGKELAVDENGNYIKNDEGEYQTVDGDYVSGNMEVAGSNTSISSQLKKNLVTGTIMGTGSVASKVLGKTAIGKTIAKATGGGSLKTVLTDVASKGANSSLIQSILTSVSKLLEKLPTIISKIPVIKNLISSDAVETFVTSLYTNIDDALQSAANGTLSKVASGLSTALVALKIATVILAGIDAWGNAESILGITEDATTGQRIIAVLIAVVNALIPVIGNLIPNKVLVNIFMSIAPKMGIDVSGLEEQRESAEAEVEAYNEENGTDYTIEEYNQTVLGKAGIVTKAKNKVKSFVTNIKEQGITKTIGNAASGVVDKVKGAASSAKAYVTDKVTAFKETMEEEGFGEAVASTLNSILPGPLGDIAGNAVRVRNMAIEGDVSGVLNANLLDVNEDSGMLTKVINTILGTLIKVPNLPVAVVSKGVHFVVDGIQSIFNKVTGYVKNTVANIKACQDDTETLINDENSTLSDFFDFSKYTDSEDNPVGGISKGIMVATRLVSTGQMLVASVGRRIGKAFKAVANVVKSNVGAVATDYLTLKETSDSGNLSGLWQQDISSGNEDSPVNGFVKAVHFVSKLSLTPNTIFHFIGGKISDFVGKVINTVKTNVSAVATDFSSMNDIAKSGDVSGLWSQDITSANEESPINGFVKVAHMAGKIAYTPNAIFHFIGGKISDFIGGVVDKVKTNVSAIGSNYVDIKTLADSGDVSGVWSYSIEGDEGSPANGLVKAAGFMTKLSATPGAIFHFIGGKISDFITSKVDAAKSDYSTMTTNIEKMKTYAEDGDVSSVWDMSYTSSEDNILGPFYKGVFTIQKLVYSATAIIKKIFGFVGDIVGGIKDFASSVVDTVKDKADSVFQSLKSFITGGRSGIAKSVGGGTNNNDYFVSQLSDQYKNIPYSNSTIGDIGCAPAAATMLINYDKPGSITMKQAINEAGNYEEVNGTSADYFGNILNKYGLSSNYINSTTSAGKKNLKNSLMNGSPAVLLGQDESNQSKDKSPFGPNKHFVVATGFDDNGNVIINDPESNSPKAYSSRILDKVSLGVATDPTTIDGDPALFSSDIGGTSTVPNNSTTQNVWGFFTSKGYSPAATAGIMGNLYAESGVDPTKIQSNGKGPAAGIAQWENYNKKSARWKTLNDYATSKGKSWTDLNSQLNMIHAETTGDTSEVTNADTYTASLMKKKAGSIDAFKNLTDVDKATLIFEEAFERAGKPNMTKRYNAAGQYYNLYSGSQYTGTYSSDAGNATGDVTSSSSSTSTSDILSTITSAFTTGFAKVFGGSDSSSSNTSSSSSGSYVDDGAVYTGNGSLTGTDEQKKLVSYMDSVKGKLSYSMSGVRNPEKGSADCSSTVNWAYKKVFGKSVGDSTLAMIDNDNTVVVDQATSGMSKSSGGTNSSGPNVNNLAPGDILLFSRPTSGFSSGRPYRVGHVEMYYGNNQTIGHGGPGKGPTVKNLSRDSKRYIQARRYKSLVSGAGSGLLDNVGGGSYPTVAPIQQPKPGKFVKYRRHVGGDSGDITTVVTKTADSSVLTLLKSLLKVAQSIANNTSNIPTLGTTLTNYCQAKLTTEVESAEANIANAVQGNDSNKVDPDDDPMLQDLMTTLGAIATG